MTTTTTSTQFDKDVELFKRAKMTFENSRLGTSAGDRAERTMNRLVEKAERNGTLEQFVRVVTGAPGCLVEQGEGDLWECECRECRRLQRAADQALVAWGRDESDTCQRGTPGCSVDHVQGSDWACGTW